MNGYSALCEVGTSEARADCPDGLLDMLRSPFWASREVVTILLQELQLASEDLYDGKRQQWASQERWATAASVPRPMNRNSRKSATHSQTCWRGRRRSRCYFLGGRRIGFRNEGEKQHGFSEVGAPARPIRPTDARARNRCLRRRLLDESHRRSGRKVIGALRCSAKNGELKLSEGVVRELRRGTDKLGKFVQAQRPHLEIAAWQVPSPHSEIPRLERFYGDKVQVGTWQYHGFWHSAAGRKSADAQVIPVAKLLQGGVAVSDDQAGQLACVKENVCCLGPVGIRPPVGFAHARTA